MYSHGHHLSNIRRKSALIEQFGGACQKCGYNRCIRAMCFHHIDSSEKKDWSNGRPQVSLEEVQEHPERFELVCANCHAEIHEAEARLKHTYTTCEFCGYEFRTQPHRAKSGRGKYCSRECKVADNDKVTRSPEGIARRFLKHVIKRDSGCWDWRGQRTPKGNYPFLQVKQANGKYTMKLAARISYEMRHGSIPDNATIERACGDPGCTNPDHLTLKYRKSITTD